MFEISKKKKKIPKINEIIYVSISIEEFSFEKKESYRSKLPQPRSPLNEKRCLIKKRSIKNIGAGKIIPTPPISFGSKEV